ncbi:crystallin J1A-like [Lingula anatina]|uniref:Crystallin J1A-like n=1 Tax=Lingula anatina TaxID=7574 RepID=A0A1S3HAW8_LINAN|nr:crystallin J1A-like [Lingula anatina]|eukprot:XP_013382274.1 crystallin J1A-like [Lingula anatina]
MASLTVKQRAVGAIVGSLVADAAGQPIHWIYNTEVLDKVLQGRTHPEFIEESHCPFYKQPTGRFTCYGDQALVVLESLAACKGFNKDDYKKRLMDTFGPASPYEPKLGRQPTREDLPIDGPWRNGSIKEFIKNYQEGKEKTGKEKDAQADGHSKVAPIVALYAGRPELRTMVEEIVRVTQDDNTPVEYAIAGALLLEEYILNGGGSSAVEKLLSMDISDTVKEQVKIALAAKDKPFRAATKEFGSSCSLPGSFICSIQSIGGADGNYVDTMRQALTSGGDNCSRNMLLGACLGAQHGVDGIPEDWIKKMSRQDVVELANQLVAARCS